jgi:putative acetyltransferase
MPGVLDASHRQGHVLEPNAEGVMSVTIHQVRPDDTRAFPEAHQAAARGIARSDDPPAVIEARAPIPITEKHVEGVLSNPDSEYRVLAKINILIVGIGALVRQNADPRACYATQRASRQGIGSLLVRKIEHTTRKHGPKTLDLHATVTAEPRIDREIKENSRNSEGEDR